MEEAKGSDSESESIDIETRSSDLEVEGFDGLERDGSVVFRDASGLLLETFLDVEGRGGLKVFGGIAAVFEIWEW